MPERPLSTVIEPPRPAGTPRVSVVIPCYNAGPYLAEAVDSVRAQTFKEWEIVIVDDGSTDPATHEALAGCGAAQARVIRTENRGLPSARNTAIAAACAPYILPLDADDRIGATLLEEAVAVLDTRPDVGIVYCQAQFFGAQSGPWPLPAFRLPDMLLQNLIFASAMFRKADWQQVGGYKPSMKYGWEDWEFWLSLLELGRKVHCIPQPLFFYRRRPDSMTAALARHPQEQDYSFGEVLRQHRRLYAAHAPWLWRNRWVFAGREHLVWALFGGLFGPRQAVGTWPTRAAATLALAAWALVQRARRVARQRPGRSCRAPVAKGSTP